MPVATQLAAMAAVQAASHHFARGQREASNELTRHAHTTWNDGNDVCSFHQRSNASNGAQMLPSGTGFGTAVKGTSR